MIVEHAFLFSNNANQVNFCGQILQFVFPYLTYLQIQGDIFEQAINEILPSFSTCFTNLKSLCLTHLKIIPKNIFVHLSKLEFLEEIVIAGAGRFQCQWTDH